MSNKIRLERFAHTPFGVFGYLWLPEIMLYTVEKPWMDNYQRISCIPGDTEYICKARPFYRKGYDAIHVTNVPDRKYILMHKGNTSNNVVGCIAVGSDLGFIDNMWAVTDSAGAFEALMDWADEEFKEHGEFRLEISDVRTDYGMD